MIVVVEVELLVLISVIGSNTEGVDINVVVGIELLVLMLVVVGSDKEVVGMNVVVSVLGLVVNFA